jgi:hypothetical protein
MPVSASWSDSSPHFDVKEEEGRRRESSVVEKRM